MGSTASRGLLDEVGNRHGRLLVIARAGSYRTSRATYATWRCQCDCGREIVATGKNLRSGNTASCGCVGREKSSKQMREMHLRHGLTNTQEFRIWIGIKTRCMNKKDPGYKNYGGRGIKLARRWFKFENFIADMGPRPSTAHTIERKDNDAGYNASNCRWATFTEQANNRRSCVRIEFDGVTRTIADWARAVGFPPTTISMRLKRGWSVEDALMRELGHRPARKTPSMLEAAVRVVA